MNGQKKIVTLDMCAVAAEDIAECINIDAKGPVYLYGIPKGGFVPALLVQHALHARGDMKFTAMVTTDLDKATHLIDDIVDSGNTRDRYVAKFNRFIAFYSFFDAAEQDAWLVFPWEVGENGSDESALDIPVRLLQFIGEDVGRGGLKDTPRRFIEAWTEHTAGYTADDSDVEDILKVFKDGAENCDEMVIVRNIPIYSHCEHHLAPFFGVCHIGYIPDSRIVGLSKFSRLVDVYAKRLQVQERLTNQIAEALQKYLKPKGVGVVLECRHLCMESRGIRQQGTTTTTSATRGVMRTSAEARAEFMTLIK